MSSENALEKDKFWPYLNVDAPCVSCPYWERKQLPQWPDRLDNYKVSLQNMKQGKQSHGYALRQNSKSHLGSNVPSGPDPVSNALIYQYMFQWEI